MYTCKNNHIFSDKSAGCPICLEQGIFSFAKPVTDLQEQHQEHIGNQQRITV